MPIQEYHLNQLLSDLELSQDEVSNFDNTSSSKVLNFLKFLICPVIAFFKSNIWALFIFH